MPFASHWFMARPFETYDAQITVVAVKRITKHNLKQLKIEDEVVAQRFLSSFRYTDMYDRTHMLPTS